MHGYRQVSSAHTLLVLLAGVSLLQLSSPAPSLVTIPGLDDNLRTDASSRATGEGPRRIEERGSVRKGGVGVEEEDEDEDELFKDVDPKTLAAVLLEALNKPRAAERRREGEEERGEAAAREEGEEEREAEGENRDRDRDGRQELELAMAAAAQGREEREREEEEERRRAQEEEERLTERVTSRTTSQTVPVKAEQRSVAPAGAGAGGGGELAGKEGEGKDEAAQGATSPAGDTQPGGEQQNEDEEEEQLSPEELKNLEKMMEEFQSYNTANKRERDSQGQRESRGYGPAPYNDILPMSKKKLKWQEETQKGMSFPASRGGNFMDDFDDNSFNHAGGNRAHPPPPPAKNDAMEEDDPEVEEEDEEEEEEEALSPEEEEARAKAEQEEVRRQAAEAQRAKVEEEKLADIASDMLLQYMVKQNAGRKYKDRKYSSSLSNAAEDKRSDEEQEVTEDDDDIDPQTIDKLIEISSKLHLPADDVVDIISDVEKKKKKDVPPESLSPWQRPLVPPPSSDNGVLTSQFSTNRNENGFPLSKQAPPSPAVNPLKTWFQEKTPSKSQLASQDLWTKPKKPLSANRDLWRKPQRPMSTNLDLWLKPQKSFRTSYSPYTPYPSYYQQSRYRGYYPIYFPPPPKPKTRYYAPKPSLALNNLQGNLADYDYNFPPKRRFRNWVQPRQRKPPASLRRNPYYGSYVLSPSLYSRTFQPASIPKPRSLPRLESPHRGQYYYSPPGPLVTRDQDYYSNPMRNQAAGDNGDEDLANYLTQILMKQPRQFQ